MAIVTSVSESNAGTAQRPDSSSTNGPSVTLPGTADDWIPKDWVIQALGHLGYMAYLQRGTGYVFILARNFGHVYIEGM